jgi:hypothetical protein
MRLAPALPLQPGLLPLGWRSFCCAAANDDARPLLSGSGNRRFVLTLDRRAGLRVVPSPRNPES